MLKKIVMVLALGISVSSACAAPTSSDPSPQEMAEFAMTVGEYERAATLLEPLAVKGNAEAQYKLGLLGTKGVIPPNTAIAWMQKSAKQGYTDAQVSLAFSYLQGDGIEKDPIVGYQWLRKAAVAGHPIAQYSLGFGLYEGLDVKQNLKEGEQWLVRAAKAGEPKAKEYLEKHGLACPHNQKQEAALFGKPLICATRSILKKAAQENGYRLAETQDMESLYFKGVFEDCYVNQDKKSLLANLCLRFVHNGLTVWRVSYNGIPDGEIGNLKKMLESEYGEGKYLPDLRQWQWKADSRVTANIEKDSANRSSLSLFLVDQVVGKEVISESMSNRMKNSFQRRYGR